MKTLFVALAILGAASIANAQSTPDQTTPADTQTPATTTSTPTTPTTTTSTPSDVVPSPTEEWQIGGGDINPYNGWAESTYTSFFALHREPAKKHYRRHHRW